MRTKHLEYEEWFCAKCGKELEYNRYQLSDLTPIPYCFECRNLGEIE